MLLINRLRICLSVNRRCEPLGYERTHVIISGVMGPIGSAFPLFFRASLFSYRVSLAIGHSHFGSLQSMLQAAGSSASQPARTPRYAAHPLRAPPPSSESSSPAPSLLLLPVLRHAAILMCCFIERRGNGGRRRGR